MMDPVTSAFWDSSRVFSFTNGPRQSKNSHYNRGRKFKSNIWVEKDATKEFIQCRASHPKR
jgi:hypothetical protein